MLEAACLRRPSSQQIMGGLPLRSAAFGLNWLTTRTPQPPRPPSSAALAAAIAALGSSTLVSNSSQLTTQLGLGTTNIILANGTYDAGAGTAFAIGACNLYAQNLGGPVFTSGIDTGSAAIVQGLAFNITDVTKTLDGGCITHFGSGALQVLDCSFNGNSVIPMAVYDVVPNGLAVRRITATNFTDEAIRASDNTTVFYKASTPAIDSIWDVNASNICYATTLSSAVTSTSATSIAVTNGANTVFGGGILIVGTEQMHITGGQGTNTLTVTRGYNGTTAATHLIGAVAYLPGTSDGTAETGVWVGHPVTNGVRRIKVRNSAWSSIEAVNNAWDTLYTDLDADMSGLFPIASGEGVGLYCEHFTINNIFRNFKLTGCKLGIDSEWDDGVFTATATTSNYTQPAVGSTVTVAVTSTSGMAASAIGFGDVYIAGGGHYTISSVTDGTHVVLRNLGFAGDAAAAATVTSGKTVSSLNGGGHRNTYRNGLITSIGWTPAGNTCGIFGDQGTEAMTVSGVTFIGQNFAGIGTFNNLGTATLTGNNFNGIGGGAVPTTTSHI